MTGRAAFLIASSAVLALVLVTAVIRPAVERGGVGEIVVVAAALAAVLLVERWLRTR